MKEKERLVTVQLTEEDLRNISYEVRAKAIVNALITLDDLPSILQQLCPDGALLLYMNDYDHDDDPEEAYLGYGSSRTWLSLIVHGLNALCDRANNQSLSWANRIKEIANHLEDEFHIITCPDWNKEVFGCYEEEVRELKRKILVSVAAIKERYRDESKVILSRLIDGLTEELKGMSDKKGSKKGENL